MDSLGSGQCWKAEFNFVNMAMNPLGSMKVGNVLAQCLTKYFSRRTLHHAVGQSVYWNEVLMTRLLHYHKQLALCIFVSSAEDFQLRWTLRPKTEHICPARHLYICILPINWHIHVTIVILVISVPAAAKLYKLNRVSVLVLFFSMLMLNLHSGTLLDKQNCCSLQPKLIHSIAFHSGTSLTVRRMNISTH
jgi:hypothetical protein